MKSRWLMGTGLVVLVAAVAAAFWLARTEGGRSDAGESVTEEVAGTPLRSERGVSILVSSPKANSVIANPLKVTGTVPGTWTFEANFGVELLDADRSSVATGHATVEGNWMTEKDLRFTALVPFEPPASTTGYLVLRKANPSDLEGTSDSLEIPIRFE